MDMEELHEAYTDIDLNVQDIVKNVEQREYQECMKQYHSKLTVFKQKLEEYSEETAKFVAYQPAELNHKVHVFEDQLMDLWNTEN